MSRLSPYLAGAFFASAGVMHFAKPDFFEAIVPDWIPSAKAANQVSGVADTVNMDHIKTHYYGSHPSINPTGIVPKGPDIDFMTAHGRSL